MKDKKALYKLTHGMYVLSTNGAACFVDAVSQVSGGDNPLVAVAVMKKNYTNEVLHNQDRFAISIFGMNDDPEIIKNYGFHTMRDYDKFANGNVEEIEGVPVAKGTIGYLVCEKVDMIENETHTLFLGKVIEADKWTDDEPMTYGYYQAHKNEVLEKKVTSKGQTAWVCTVCGYVYLGEELPEDFVCPVCGVDASLFEKQETKEEVKEPKKEEVKKVETKWVCTVCGYEYVGEELPEGYECPACGVDASLFEKQ